MTGISTALAAVAQAVGSVVAQRPLTGLHVVTIDHWTIALNASMEPAKYQGNDLGAFTAQVTSDRYLVAIVLDPTGGIVGGMPEDEFIAEMERISGPKSDAP